MNHLIRSIIVLSVAGVMAFGCRPSDEAVAQPTATTDSVETGGKASSNVVGGAMAAPPGVKTGTPGG